MKPQHFAVVAGFLLLTAVVLIATGRPQPGPANPASSQDHLVTVVGEGEVRAKPNLVRIGVGIWTSGTTAGEAEAQNQAAVARVRAALVAAGLDEDGLETASPSIVATTNQDYAGLARISGFQVRTRVVGVLRNLSRVQSAIDAALAAGATSLEEVSYTLESEEAVKQEAVSKALANAKARADAIAQSEGPGLGDLVSVEVLEEPAATAPASSGGLLLKARVKATFQY